LGGLLGSASSSLGLGLALGSASSLFRRGLSLGLASSSLGTLFGLEESLVDIFIESTLGDDDVAEEFNKIVVFLDTLEDVGWDDSLSVLILGLFSGEFKNFGAQKFEDSSHVDWGSIGDSLEVTSMSEHSSDSSNWHFEIGSLGLAHGWLVLLTFGSSWHFSINV
jgi:hypothetical protein